jgi:hypothetical protein
MRRQLVSGRLPHHERFGRASPAALFGGLRNIGVAPRAGVLVQGERALPARHRQIHIRQQLRVEQCAVQVAAGVVDTVAFAQRVE